MGGTGKLSGEGCLICKAPLEYLTQEQEMECAICHKKESSKTRCVNGHYVCSDCHPGDGQYLRPVSFRDLF